MNPFKAHKAQDDDAVSVSSSVEDDHRFPVADAKGHLAYYEEEHRKQYHKECGKLLCLSRSLNELIARVYAWLIEAKQLTSLNVANELNVMNVVGFDILFRKASCRAFTLIHALEID
jgi:hypothetical protein